MRHITLTKKQQYVVDEAAKFWKSDSEQIFQYAGEAGTGKSIVLEAIKERLGIPARKIAPMAYIGQAAIIMRMKGMTNAKTVYSWLFNPVEDYLLDKDGRIVKDTYFNTPKYTIKFEPKPLDDIDLMLIDEAPSCPYDLRGEIVSRNKKIIATGDLGQLPPVYGKPAFLYEGKVHILTDVMAQQSGSALLYLAYRARRGLPIHPGFYGDVLVIEENDLTDQMIIGSDIVICAKNATRDKINKRVRHDILHIYSDLPTCGERVVCRRNNWTTEVDGINLANGLLGTVVNMPSVEGFDGKAFTMSFKPNFINGYFSNLKCDYNYLIAPHEQKQMLKNNKFNRSEKFEFAYAITCHMAQGGRFRNGIYIEEFLNKDIQNNLNYTGITRFSNSLIYVKRSKKYY